MRGAQRDTYVGCTDPKSNYIPGYLVYPLNKPQWEWIARACADPGTPTLLRQVNQSSKHSIVLSGKKLIKYIYPQWQSNWLLVSQLFHSDGECICSLCMDPKWQWLTLQGVGRGRHFNPCGPGGHVDTSPCSESQKDPPTARKATFSSLRPWRYSYEPCVLWPGDNTHQINYSSVVFNPNPKFSKFCLFFGLLSPQLWYHT